jgi:hypothetical protein
LEVIPSQFLFLPATPGDSRFMIDARNVIETQEHTGDFKKVVVLDSLY